jgi:hypothetical protein
LAHCIHRYHYNFGPEDHSNVYVSDLKLILNAARGKGSEIKRNHHLQRRRRGKKVVPDYDVFKQYKRVGYMGKRMGKIESGTRSVLQHNKNFIDGWHSIVVNGGLGKPSTEGKERCRRERGKRAVEKQVA